MAQDRITLTVPASGEYAKVVRMSAAALVSRLGVSYDEVEDVRMAAEEAFVYATDSSADGDEVTITFLVGDDMIGMDVCLGDKPALADEEVETRAAYATFILQSVCDRYEFSSDESGRRHLKLEKRLGDADAG